MKSDSAPETPAPVIRQQARQATSHTHGMPQKELRQTPQTGVNAQRPATSSKPGLKPANDFYQGKRLTNRR